LVKRTGLAMPRIPKRARRALSNDHDEALRVGRIWANPGLFALAEDLRKLSGAPFRCRALKTVEMHDDVGAGVVHDSVVRVVRASLARNPMRIWEPSQNGFLADAPHRHSATPCHASSRSPFEFVRSSTATRYGPSRNGVMRGLCSVGRGMGTILSKLRLGQMRLKTSRPVSAGRMTRQCRLSRPIPTIDAL